MIDPKDIKIVPTIAVPAIATTEAKAAPEGKIMLRDGTSVPKKHYDSLLSHLLPRMQPLTTAREYRLKDMCSPRFLMNFPMDNTIAGKCLSLMVEEKLLPLTVAGRTVQNAKLYMRM